MEKRIKRGMLCLMAACLCMVSGCSKDTEEENKQEEVSLIANTVYESPKNATRNKRRSLMN